jgi:hypothetical protein
VNLNRKFPYPHNILISLRYSRRNTFYNTCFLFCATSGRTGFHMPVFLTSFVHAKYAIALVSLFRFAVARNFDRVSVVPSHHWFGRWTLISNETAVLWNKTTFTGMLLVSVCWLMKPLDQPNNKLRLECFGHERFIIKLLQCFGRLSHSPLISCTTGGVCRSNKKTGPDLLASFQMTLDSRAT